MQLDEMSTFYTTLSLLSSPSIVIHCSLCQRYLFKSLHVLEVETNVEKAQVGIDEFKLKKKEKRKEKRKDQLRSTHLSVKSE